MNLLTGFNRLGMGDRKGQLELYGEGSHEAQALLLSSFFPATGSGFFFLFLSGFFFFF